MYDLTPVWKSHVIAAFSTLLHISNAISESQVSCMQGGSDVITKTALKRINWASYKMNQSSDKIGVFVSVVSTKIPYKGAGKEYIGEGPIQSFWIE